MNQAKHHILMRLRSAGATGIKSEPLIRWEQYRHSDEKEKVKSFTRALVANHAEVKSIPLCELPATLACLCQEKGWHKAVMGVDGCYEQQIQQGVASIQSVRYSQPFETLKDELFQRVDVGITHTAAGIAQTGALVLKAGPEEPRTLSLIPPCHVAVVRQSAIYLSLSEVMAQQQWSENMPSNLLLISGPSKTADIQSILAYGAHGPAELIVIVLSDQ